MQRTPGQAGAPDMNDLHLHLGSCTICVSQLTMRTAQRLRAVALATSAAMQSANLAAAQSSQNQKASGAAPAPHYTLKTEMEVLKVLLIHDQAGHPTPLIRATVEVCVRVSARLPPVDKCMAIVAQVLETNGRTRSSLRRFSKCLFIA